MNSTLGSVVPLAMFVILGAQCVNCTYIYVDHWIKISPSIQQLNIFSVYYHSLEAVCQQVCKKENGLKSFFLNFPEQPDPKD